MNNIQTTIRVISLATLSLLPFRSGYADTIVQTSTGPVNLGYQAYAGAYSYPAANQICNPACGDLLNQQIGLGQSAIYNNSYTGATGVQGTQYSVGFYTQGTVFTDGSFGILEKLNGAITGVGSVSAEKLEGYISTEDDLVINSTKLTGQTGSATIQVLTKGGGSTSISGLLSGCVNGQTGGTCSLGNNLVRGDVHAGFSWGVGTVGCLGNPLTSANTCSGNPSAVDITTANSYSYTFSFTYGQPFELVQSLSVFGDVTVTSGFGSAQGAETIDYLDPIQIAQIAVTDANGNSVNDWTITSGSGLDYTATGISAAAPEPGSYALAGLGLLGLAVVRRKLPKLLSSKRHS